MSNSVGDLVDSLVELIWQVSQDRKIANQASQTATLEERVTRLEHQLRIAQQVVLALARELKPELGKQLEVEALATTPKEIIAPAAGWRVSRLDQAGGMEVPLLPEYGTEEEAQAEARRLVAIDREAKVYVTGWQGRRYRVLP